MSALRIGTRGSDLALWQAHHVRDRLGVPCEIVVIKTEGDRVQDKRLDQVDGKGFFTKEIEEALRDNKIDVAVHSLKDLPIEEQDDFEIAAIVERGPFQDVMVVHGEKFDKGQLFGISQGAKVGTSSLRRRAHALAARPDLQMVDIRGNVPTRLYKAKSGEVDAVILAEAGLVRLNLVDDSSLRFVPLDPNIVCPAPGQGAVAVQARRGDQRAMEATAKVHDPPTATCVGVERGLLARFGGGCHLPLGALCEWTGPGLRLRARVASPNGQEHMDYEEKQGPAEDLIERAYESLLAQGADKYL